MSDDFDPDTVTWVMNEEQLDHLCAAIERCREVIVDLETTGLDEYATAGGLTNGGYPARIVLASFTLPSEDDGPVGPSTWLLPLSHPDSPWLGRWRRTLRRVTLVIRDGQKPVINANVKFDCRWVWAHVRVDLSSRIVWDTQNSSHLLDENSSTRLKVRASETFDVPPWDDFDLTTPGAAERVPLFDLGLYAARDTYWTWRLAERHRDEMFLTEIARLEEPDSTEEREAARLGRLAVWCAMPTVATLTAVEQRGMRLDTDWVLDELTEHRQTIAQLGQDLAHRYPSAERDPENYSFAPTSHWFMDWAQAAVNAGDLVVAELTPNGKPRWAKGVLVRQARAGSEVAQSLLEYRQHSKKAEYLTSWLGLRTPDGKIHTTYHSGSVVTGRLSSSVPNMQQVTATLKPAFVPSEGHYFAEFDYSQIELRIAAFISRCIPMLEAFRRGDDLHRLLASRITGKDPFDVLPTERQAGKSANFGLLYGMQAYGFREYAETVYGVSFTVEEARAIYQAFFDTWDGIAQWHLRCVNRVHQTGQVTSPIGRVRRLPMVWDANEKLASFAERAAINSPVQGFASDLMQMAAASIEGNLPGTPPVKNARLVGTVHDSILAEVPIDNWEEVTRSCRHRMLTIGDALRRLDCVLDVPLEASVKIGTRWGLSDVGTLA